MNGLTHHGRNIHLVDYWVSAFVVFILSHADDGNKYYHCSTSRGIGLELVRQLSASSSNTIIATCRNPAGATDLQAVKEKAQGTVHIVPLDITSETSILESVKPVSEILGDKGLDYIYNNAAIVSTNICPTIEVALLTLGCALFSLDRTQGTTRRLNSIGTIFSGQ